MAKLEDLKIGDHVSFLLMSNTAVSMTGTIAKFHEEDPSRVDIFIDDHPLNSIDTTYVDYVTLLPPAPVEAASPALEANLEKLGVAHEGNVVDIPKAD
jgi:hypothetical protein